MRGNFLSIPTDCPQRDERLGWTGDIQVFSPTASFLYDCDGVPHLVAARPRPRAGAQRRRGPARHPRRAPVLRRHRPDGGVGRCRDRGARPCCTSASATSACSRPSTPACGRGPTRSFGMPDTSGPWAGRMQLGDWLDPVGSARQARAGQGRRRHRRDGLPRPVAPPGRPTPPRCSGSRRTPPRYAALAERSRAAFVSHYVTPAGRMMSDAPTAYALALEFDLVTDPAAAAGARRPPRGGRARGRVPHRHRFRRHPARDRRAHRRRAPRRRGAAPPADRVPVVALPRDDGGDDRLGALGHLLPDGSVNPGEMTSFNHYALGAVADWLHRTVAGLAPDAPGLRAPAHRAATAARARARLGAAPHAVRRGIRRVGARRIGDRRDAPSCPPNTTAVVDLPGRRTFEVGSGTHEWRMPAAPGIRRARRWPGSTAPSPTSSTTRGRTAPLLDTLAAFDPRARRGGARRDALGSEPHRGLGAHVRAAAACSPRSTRRCGRRHPELESRRLRRETRSPRTKRQRGWTRRLSERSG